MDAANDQAVAGERAAFRGKFACFLFDLPKLTAGHTYKLSLLIYDENKRIVGENNAGEFKVEDYPWKGHRIGLDDVVWEPFTPLQKTADGLETLKHRITLTPLGLPAQVFIKPDPRELPIERRGAGAQLADAELVAIGRGPQLAAPMRLQAAAGGKRHEAQVVQPAKLVREWKSEFQYASKLKVGPLDVALDTQYDCDGAMRVRMTYGAPQPVEVEAFEMLTDLNGLFDLAVSAMHGGGMAGPDRWECTLPASDGVVWDSASVELPELYYSHFVPWIFFGSGDRGFTWFCDSDRQWLLDRDGSAMTLERDGKGHLTWRVKFVNHKTTVQGNRTIEFNILTHPAKPKPEDFRKIAWFYQGDTWAAGYAVEPIELDEDYLKQRWHEAASAPKDMPYEQAAKWRKDTPPWTRYGRWRNVGVCPELDQMWEDKAVYFLERQIRVGRRDGWWWDEYWPTGFGRSDNLAMGNAYLRDPATVGENELPWQSAYLTTYMRDTQKRLARVFAANNVPQRSYHWANNSATTYESFAWDCQLVEEAGSDHRSFELDNVTVFPIPLVCYLSHNYTGLVARLAPRNAWPNNVISTPGDDKRLDRQLFGRALLNDIGVLFQGPHGCIQQGEQAVRILNALARFGFFEDEGTEYLPYWRNGALVRYGEAWEEQGAFNVTAQNPAARVKVSVFRRPMERDGRKGFEAMFVLMNHHDEAVRERLYVLDPTRIFGGPNRLTAQETIGGYDFGAIPTDGDWRKEKVLGLHKDYAALQDMEDTGVVRAADNKGQAGEIYGPIHILPHDYRIVYGYWLAE
jgi:hypothetical protein